MILARRLREWETATGSALPDPGTLVPMGYEKLSRRSRMLAEEVRELEEASSLEDQLKELTDVLYVAVGCAVTIGLSDTQIQELFEIVHDANMTKTLGGIQRLPDGKVAKSDTYIPPMGKIRIWIDVTSGAKDF